MQNLENLSASAGEITPAPAVLAEPASFQFPVQAFPPAFQADVLGTIFGLSLATVSATRSRKPWRLPPACDTGGRRPVWLLSDVLAWLAERREKIVVRAPPAQPAAPRVHSAPGALGRPTKVERAAAAAAGLTVRQHRDLVKGGAK